jgi:hypothetical protein
MSSKLGTRAREYFLKGYSRSQSVLWALAEEWDLPAGIAPRAGSALGGEVGAKRKKKLYVTMHKLIKAFERKHGAVVCRDIIHLDLSDSDQLAIYHQLGKRRNPCSHLVVFTADWMTENLDY